MGPAALEEQVLALDITKLLETPVEYVPDLGMVSAKDGDAMERRGGLRADFRLRTQQDVGGAGGGEEQVTRRKDTAERNEHAASYC